ncbi:MAG: hypothetical protein R6U98_03785 [Pirellulaceae bacterium]
MCVKQAIYTSVRTGRNEGYQLAARSPGISDQEARELTQWGPGHDSLYHESADATSINFHYMESGIYCVSQTQLAGREYSGRGGRRVHTHLFLVPEQKLLRFANNPFRVMDALIAAGRVERAEQVPERLEPVNLVGRASSVNTNNLKEVVRHTGPHKLAVLVNAALNCERLGLVSKIPGKKLFRALLDLLPLPLRPAFSLTTGLRVSATRSYRLVVLPPLPDEQRRAVRQVHLDVLDLTGDLPAKYAPKDGWPELMHHLLRTEQFDTIVEVINAASRSRERNITVLAEQQRQLLEHETDQATISPFR